MIRRLLILCAVFSLSGIAPASAHLLAGEHGSMAAGFTHPLFGLDHILVMVAVGLWAYRIGGRAVRLGSALQLYCDDEPWFRLRACRRRTAVC